MTIFHHKLLTREGRVFVQWMNSSIIHDNICSLIHKKCHSKKYNSDIKYHMTLNNIVCVTDEVVRYRVCGGHVNLPLFSLPFLHCESAFSLLFLGMAFATHVVDSFEHLFFASISTSFVAFIYHT